MNTYALQLVLHFQSDRSDETRFEAFMRDVRTAAEARGISFDEHQSMQLPATDYAIRACDRCGHLTVNKEDVGPADENMLPDFWFYIRRGRVTERTSLCDICQVEAHAT